ncbi:MAG: glycosyltransferase family 2 protein [Candidatus Micrarchaeota archaeon]
MNKCKENVEICVSDNGSTDNTFELLENYAKKITYLRIRRNEKNLGFDVNLFEVLKMAKGKYIWTMGDDDIVMENEIPKIIQELENKVLGSGYVAGLIASGTVDGSKEIKKFFPRSEYQTNEFLDAYKSYLMSVRAAFAPAFGFISCFLFKKSEVEKSLAEFDRAYYGWAHIVLYLHIISQSKGLIYVHHKSGIILESSDTILLPGEEIEMSIEQRLSALKKVRIEPELMKIIEMKMLEEKKKSYLLVLVKSVLIRDLIDAKTYSKVKQNVYTIEQKLAYPIWQKTCFALFRYVGEIWIMRAIGRFVVKKTWNKAARYLKSVERYGKGLIKTNADRENTA